MFRGVLLSANGPVFKRPIRLVLRASARISPPFLCFLCLFLLPASSRANSLEDAARTLARKVAAIPGLRSPLDVSWGAQVAFSAEQSEVMRRAFQEELSNRFSLAAKNPANIVSVMICETPSTVRLIATTYVSEVEQIRMTDFPKADSSVLPQRASPARLDRQLLWQQREKLLDAVELTEASGKPSVLLLNKDSLGVFEREQDHLTQRFRFSIPAAGRASRDENGTIEVQWNPNRSFEVRFLEMSCRTEGLSSGALNCSPEPGKRRESSEPRQENSITSSSCGAVGWDISTGKGDWTKPDQLFLAPTAPYALYSSVAKLDLPGPVMSLSSAQDLHSVLVVVFNLDLGAYEVYRITLSCGE